MFSISIGYYNGYIKNIGTNNIGAQPITCVILTNPYNNDNYIDLVVYYNGNSSGNIIYFDLISTNSWPVDYSVSGQYTSISGTDAMARLEHRYNYVSQFVYLDTLPDGHANGCIGECVLIRSN